MCFLQLAHGADPFLKNQEGQAPVDLATADDVRCLLQDAMASQQAVPIASAASSRPPSIALPQASTPPALPLNSETVIMPSGASVQLSLPVASRASISMSISDECCSSASVRCDTAVPDVNSTLSISGFLAR